MVLSWLDDPNAGYFTLPQVNVWINNAQKETQKLLIRAGENYYVEKMLGQLIAGTETYTLPSDFKKCHKLQIVIAGTAGTTTEVRTTLEWVTLMQLEALWQSTGQPVAYNIRRNILTVAPIPDQAYPIYLYQSYQCIDMALAADLPDCPEDYTEYIAVLATLDGFLKDQRDPSPFVVAKQEKYLKMMERDMADRNVSQPKSIVVTDAGAWGSPY